jgi:hypothetical protein
MIVGPHISQDLPADARAMSGRWLTVNVTDLCVRTWPEARRKCGGTTDGAFAGGLARRLIRADEPRRMATVKRASRSLAVRGYVSQVHRKPS